MVTEALMSSTAVKPRRIEARALIGDDVIPRNESWGTKPSGQSRQADSAGSNSQESESHAMGIAKRAPKCHRYGYLNPLTKLHKRDYSWWSAR